MVFLFFGSVSLPRACFGQASLKFLNPSGGVNNLFPPSEKWMAGTTDFNFNFFFC